MTPRLFWLVYSTETRKLMTYRVDFWITAVLNFVVSITVPYFLWTAVFESAGMATVAGYTLHEMVLYYCLAVLLGRVVRGSDQLRDISTDIYEGSLSRYLLYPAGYLPFKYAQHLANLLPSVLQLALLGPAIAGVIGLPASVAISWGSIFLALAAVAIGNALYYLMSFTLQTVAFWADNIWSLIVMMRIAASLLGGLLIPLSCFPEWAQAVLAWTPFPCLYHLPVNALLGKSTFAQAAAGLATSLAWCVLFFGAARLIWRRGTLQYTGVGI
ncbi:MAG: ABC-2 family transporter protein [Planctomycetes bacterium]|nr:ABC-2 family transporter protein [Planctomycetota bacterium]